MNTATYEGLEVGYDVPALPGMNEADIQTPCLLIELDALNATLKPWRDLPAKWVCVTAFTEKCTSQLTLPSCKKRWEIPAAFAARKFQRRKFLHVEESKMF